jgi:hypothetical protein
MRSHDLLRIKGICKDRLTKVQETPGQYFEKEGGRDEAGQARGVVKRVIQGSSSPDGDGGDSPF